VLQKTVLAQEPTERAFRASTWLIRENELSAIMQLSTVAYFHPALVKLDSGVRLGQRAPTQNEVGPRQLIARDASRAEPRDVPWACAATHSPVAA